MFSLQAGGVSANILIFNCFFSLLTVVHPMYFSRKEAERYEHRYAKRFMLGWLGLVGLLICFAEYERGKGFWVNG